MTKMSLKDTIFLEKTKLLGKKRDQWLQKVYIT